MLAAPVNKKPAKEIKNIPIGSCLMGASIYPKVPEKATVMDNLDFNRAI
jgi:hypothetical protein